ncbi:CocE/NonD family hydrolase [Arsenicitalea aurantiaca]|uniref:CocE/NonD family hydrolase n=1 Tax=Arsenicitalea aurantiaca TaxID=1783274 RepID=A0A433X4A9_9HYPH|nr:CocE/NonD family hydrolase [Arsenicitalea aurantiaca]RUT28881.1 CocE/NonD family hydrolase [Arsenicitalea aurantiaca]
MTIALPTPSDQSPVRYTRAPSHEGMIVERDVRVPMRDGKHLCIDVYRPETDEKLPVLLAFAIYNKDMQGPETAEAIQPQPSWSTLWCGPLEAGDTHFLVSRGYVHVIGSPRGIGKSEGGGSREFDSYDLIEWIARQPWCDGQVGMVGISGFGAEQVNVARQNPPSLKAIFPFDPRSAYGRLGGFREEYPGGMVHLFRYLIGHFSAFHQVKGQPGELEGQRKAWWEAAMADPDLRMYPHLYNVLVQRGQHLPAYFDILINPYDTEEIVAESEREFGQIRIPFYTGSGWYAYTYKTHLQGAQTYFEKVDAPKKLLFTGPGHLERPFHTLHEEILRWYDHWLKGMDTGIMDEPPVRYWVMGENAWRTGEAWPLPETQWTKFHLNSWERLSTREFTEKSADDFIRPDAFVQMPPTQTNQIAKLRYLSDPMPEDTLMAGPAVLNIFAEIDAEDTNWIVILKDVGPDVSVQTVREGERSLPSDLKEREITRGWLKASHKAVDTERSRPWKPWHPMTREAQEKIVPGEINAYAIEILAAANMFRKGHRICIEITSADLPTGVAGSTNAEYIPYHVCSSRTVLHKIYHDPAHPSHLLLPLVPTGA